MKNAFLIIVFLCAAALMQHCVSSINVQPDGVLTFDNDILLDGASINDSLTSLKETVADLKNTVGNLSQWVAGISRSSGTFTAAQLVDLGYVNYYRWVGDKLLLQPGQMTAALVRFPVFQGTPFHKLRFSISVEFTRLTSDCDPSFGFDNGEKANIVVARDVDNVGGPTFYQGVSVLTANTAFPNAPSLIYQQSHASICTFTTGIGTPLNYPGVLEFSGEISPSSFSVGPLAYHHTNGYIYRFSAQSYNVVANTIVQPRAENNYTIFLSLFGDDPGEQFYLHTLSYEAAIYGESSLQDLF